MIALMPFVLVAIGIGGAFLARAGKARIAVLIVAAIWIVSSVAIWNTPPAVPKSDEMAMLNGFNLLAFIVGLALIWAGVPARKGL